MVDTAEIQRKQRKSQWATRYNDRLPESALQGQPYEEGQENGSSVDIPLEGGNAKPRRQPTGELWSPEDEHFYNPDKSSAPSSSGRWHYPANFDDVEPINAGKEKKKKKKDRKDRWKRTEDAYAMTSEEGSRKKRRSKRKSSDTARDDESNEFPEDPEGGLYGERRQVPEEQQKNLTEEQVFSHQF